MLGDRVSVTGKNATHHGDKGVVVAFCKNESKINVFVELEKNGRTRIGVHNLTYDEVSTKSTDNTETQSVPASDISFKSSATSTKSGINKDYGIRVLSIYEYVSDLKDNYHEDKELFYKLKEVEKMILALTLE